VEAAKIATAVRARRLLLFHHDPAHNDDQVENMAEEARNHCDSAEPAREGKRIVLCA
jgi:ribonuclease BN (tRNA processing enzyme)